jgi:hypothetical protein
MTGRSPDDARAAWKEELGRSPDCIPLERFAETLTAGEREHLAHCARCEAELALWQEFRDAGPAADEGAAVRWIVAETRRRLTEPAAFGRRPAGWRDWMQGWRPRTVALAASVLAAVAVGYFVADRGEPQIAPAPGVPVYRSSAVQLIGPAGDLTAPPTELRWVAVAGATRYDVELREVDGSVVWRASTAGAHIALPAAVAVLFAPGRTLLWQVRAIDGGGALLAESAIARCRVLVTGRRE